MENIKLRPHNIIVIGGGSGIGKAITQRLLDNGATNIVIASRNLDKLKEAQKSFNLKEGQNVYSVAFDITKVNSHLEMINNAQKVIGIENKLDGLVISAGVNFDGSNWKGFNVSEADWDRVMNTNLKGTFFILRNFANYLSEKQTKGNICVISSISAHRDMLSPYQIAKHSLSRIVQAYGKHLCERGVVLNCVEPGPIYTDMMKHLEKYTDGIREGAPWNDASIRRLVRPEEIADVVCYLMSNLGEVLSGSCIVAAGGTKSIFPS
ncbi:MAG: SDR family oxidoreductase [Clostridiales bacterium]|nr:SDR family oxidoreductase [Clostridiales bacterium]